VVDWAEDLVEVSLVVQVVVLVADLVEVSLVVQVVVLAAR
jgi:hypothetical protein